MTRFKAMIMDEQVETKEQMAQEDLRVREENNATKATKAQRRGMLLLEGAQRVIQQLENNPELVEMMRITLVDPITIREELNGSESTQLDETSGLENPRVPSPQAR
jgi:hypothetical protein